MKTDDRSLPEILADDNILNALIERENPDEMGLLDLIYREAILNQKQSPKTGLSGITARSATAQSACLCPIAKSD